MKAFEKLAQWSKLAIVIQMESSLEVWVLGRLVVGRFGSKTKKHYSFNMVIY